MSSSDNLHVEVSADFLGPMTDDTLATTRPPPIRIVWDDSWLMRISAIRKWYDFEQAACFTAKRLVSPPYFAQSADLDFQRVYHCSHHLESRQQRRRTLRLCRQNYKVGK